MLPDREKLSQCPVCAHEPLKPWDEEALLEVCSHCESVIDNPRPTMEFIESFYSKTTQYDHWLNSLENRNILWKKRFALLSPWLKSGTIMDVGAGIGQFLHIAKQAGLQVDGSELSPVARQEALDKFGISIRAGQLEELSLPTGSYDAVSMFHVLEHVPYPAKTLRECHRLLKENGILIIAVPNEVHAITAVLHRFTGLLKHQKRGKMGIKTLASNPNLQEIHLTRFTAKSLKLALQSNGFTPLYQSIDPHLPVVGIRGIILEGIYAAARVCYALTGWNPYPTHLIVARKSAL